MRRKFLSNGMERGEERALFVSSTELVINRYFAFSDIAWQLIIRFNVFLETYVIPESKLFSVQPRCFEFIDPLLIPCIVIV